MRILLDVFLILVAIGLSLVCPHFRSVHKIVQIPSNSLKSVSLTTEPMSKVTQLVSSYPSNIGDFVIAFKNLAVINAKSRLHHHERDSLIKSVEDRLLSVVAHDLYLSVYQCTDLIWSCGKLKARYQAHTALIQILISQFFSSSEQITFDCKSVSSALIGLSSMDVKFHHLNARQQSQLVEIISSIVNFDAWGVANIIYALGVMNAGNYLPPSLIKHLKGLVEQHIFSMRNNGVSNTIYGMGLLNFSTSSHTIFKTILHRELPNMNAQAYSNTLYGLGKMGFEFNNADPNLRSVILSSFDKVIPEMSVIGLSCSLFGLATIGVSFDDWSEPSQRRLLSSFRMLLPQMDTRAVSGVITSLGKMELHFSHIDYDDVSLPKVVFDVLTEQVLQMNGREIALLVYGFSLWNIRWMNLPTTLRKNIITTLNTKSEELDAKDVVNVLFGLGKMHCSIVPKPRLISNENSTIILEGTDLYEEECMKMELQRIIFPLLLRKVELLQMEEISGVLYSLGRVVRGGYISCVPPELRHQLQYKLRAMLDVMNEQALANAIFGLAKMGAQWSRLPPFLQQSLSEALKNRLKSMTTYGLCNLLRGLVTIGFSWKNAGPLDLHRLRLQQSIATAMNSMSERGVADTLGALAAMDAAWSTLSRDTKLALCKALLEAIPDVEESSSDGKSNQLTNNYSKRSSNLKKSESVKKKGFGKHVKSNDSNIQTTQPTTSKQVNIDELCTMMQSLAVLSFDADYSQGYDKLLSGPHVVNGSDAESTILLYFAHGRLLSAYKSLLADCLQPINTSFAWNNHGVSDFKIRENQQSAECKVLTDLMTSKQWTQLAIYFTMMMTVHQCKQLVFDVLGDKLPPDLDQFPLDQECLPSQFHTRVERSLQQELEALCVDDNLTLVSEFCGLGKFLPMDIAVMNKNTTPIALIEVDGDFHYTAALAPDLDDELEDDRDMRQVRKMTTPLNNKPMSTLPLRPQQQEQKPILQTVYTPALRRADRLKEFLYKKAFPQARMHRVTLRSVKKHGLKTVCGNLATLVVNDYCSRL